MEIDLARYVVRAAFRSGRELEELLDPLKKHCSADEYVVYARAIATATASIQLEVINKVLSAHPELEGEIESKIAKYDRFI